MPISQWWSITGSPALPPPVSSQFLPPGPGSPLLSNCLLPLYPGLEMIHLMMHLIRVMGIMICHPGLWPMQCPVHLRPAKSSNVSLKIWKRKNKSQSVNESFLSLLNFPNCRWSLNLNRLGFNEINSALLYFLTLTRNICYNNTLLRKGYLMPVFYEAWKSGVQWSISTTMS